VLRRHELWIRRCGCGAAAGLLDGGSSRWGGVAAAASRVARQRLVGFFLFFSKNGITVGFKK